MKSHFLFPHRWQLFGAILLVLGVVFYLFEYHQSLNLVVWKNFWPNINANPSAFNTRDEYFDNEIQLTLVLVGLVLLSFSKEKLEDEQIAQLRLDCLQWAVYLNYIIFFVLIFFSYGSSFLYNTMYNMFTLLLFFFIRFRWKIYQLNRSVKLADTLS